MTAGNATPAVFNLTVTVAIGDLTKASGDGQSVVIGQQFQPVSVKVTDTQGNAVAGVAVTFNAAGSATPASDTAVTNASGVAQATFTATNNPGQVAITASAGGKSVAFNLAARLPGPMLTADSFLNAASMQEGISFGSIVAIKGEGFTTGLTIPPGACLTEVSDGNLQRELPTRLAGIEVRFEYVHLAPILAICKTSDGSDQINVQAPFELAPAGINISVTTGVGTAAETNGVRWRRGDHERPAGHLRVRRLLHRPRSRRPPSGRDSSLSDQPGEARRSDPGLYHGTRTGAACGRRPGEDQPTRLPGAEAVLRLLQCSWAVPARLE